MSNPWAVFSLVLRRWRGLGAVVALALCAGCTTTSLVLGVVGVATDTSIPWAITKHLYGKLTEGDPVPCFRLNSVQRALSPRCGRFDEGSLRAEDIANSGLQECPLTVAAHDPRLWPVLPELISKGAKPESCHVAPLVLMAQLHECADFSKASPESLAAVQWLARHDARSVHHDVVRLLSCPSAQQAGLSGVLGEWLQAGALPARGLPFGVMGALHPSHLDSEFSRLAQAQGHTAQAALGVYTGQLASGYELALRTGHWAAVDWWLRRVPSLIHQVPASRADQTAWVPLARVLSPKFMAVPEQQEAAVRFLLLRGASPWQTLPHRPSQTVMGYARWLQSEHIALLDPPESPVPPRRAPVRVALADHEGGR